MLHIQSLPYSCDFNTQKLPLPDRSQCDMLTSDLFTRLNPATGHVLTLTSRGGPSPWWSPVVGQNARDQWLRFRDEASGFDLLSLGYVADLVSVTRTSVAYRMLL
jgi:hypothetical protein